MGNAGGGSGRYEELERACGSSGRCSRGQAQMSEDLGDHRGIFNGGDDLQGATAMGAALDVDIEYPFEQAGPAQAGRSRVMGRTCRII